jgi:hypothetical protein
MSVQRDAQDKRWRGVILGIVRTGHQKQESRLDDLGLWALLQDLSYPVSQNDVRTLVQELGELGYLRFNQITNEATNEVRIDKIEITAHGLRIMTRIEKDPLVLVV